MPSELSYLSLGWGVQSWTVAAMMAYDEIPRADYLIHADTTWERESTYAFASAWSQWLSEHGLTVETVTSPKADIVRRWASSTPGVMIPAFTLAQDGKHGQMGRQCTQNWKIDPIRRFVSGRLAERGLPKRPGTVTAYMGISQDEWTRMRDSDVQYIVNSYPLIDRRMTRQDCMNWLADHELPVPQKSSCVFCPYHSRSAWKQMGREGGQDWLTAVKVDEAVRDTRDPLKVFVHPLRGPLEQVAGDDGQLEMWPEATCDSGQCFT